VPTLEERVTIARPLNDVFRLLSHDDAEWLRPFIRIAAHKGERAGAELRSRLQPRDHAREGRPRVVTVDIGPPSVVVEGGAIELPMHLELTGYGCVFATLDGRLVLSEAPEGTSLTLAAGFEPPATMGSDLDDARVAQHAAQTAVRELIDTLRIAMENESSVKGIVEEPL
jgi:hypothetical protein